MRNKETSRLIVDMKRHNIDVFDEFGRYNYVNTQTILPTHIHPDMIEICYLAKGSQEYFVGNNTFRLYGGDVFVAFPDEIHGTGNVPEEKGVLYWMVLKRPEAGKDYLGLSHPDACELFPDYYNCPRDFSRAVPNVNGYFKRLSLSISRIKDTLIKMELNNLLVSFLLQIIHAGERTTDRSYSDRITQIVHYINENLFETLDLESLADKCNLSLSRFKHLFKEETGIPPSEYIIRRKVEKAQELMKDQKLSIKNIAYDLGFSSPAYFSTVFKQYNGYSPTLYKKKDKSK